MAAVISGAGLGLYNTSLTQLGQAQGGDPKIGQSRENQYVNIATGNLILQDQDENLLVRGLSATLLRTYNSRGTVAGVGQDGWITGFERKVGNLTGTVNTAGSTISLCSGDGQSVVFTYSTTSLCYVSSSGDGANDTLTWNGTNSQWTYVEGSTQRQEVYASATDPVLQGRLLKIVDLRSDGTTPAEFDVYYDANNRVSEVRSVDDTGSTTNSDAILFTYNGTTTQLASITTREGGVVKSQLSYGLTKGPLLFSCHTLLAKLSKAVCSPARTCGSHSSRGACSLNS